MNQEQVGKSNLASQSEPTLPAESRALGLPRTAEKILKIVNLVLSRKVLYRWTVSQFKEIIPHFY